MAVVVMAIWMPETRGQSLEDIQAGFQRLTMNSGVKNLSREKEGGMRLRRLLKGPVLVGSEGQAGGVLTGSDASGLGLVRIDLSDV